MIQTQDLQFAYPNGPTFNFPNISLGRHKQLLILGDSGIGKTTLLHLIGLLLHPEKGSIQIDNTEVTTLGQAQKDRFRGQHIGIVFQRPHFVQSLNVLQNIEAKLYFSKTKVQTKEIDNILVDLDLLACKHKKIRELSEGQKQRLSIAIALLNSPGLILADEPTSNLDDKNCEKVLALLKSTAKNVGANLILITHDQRIRPFFKNTLEL